MSRNDRYEPEYSCHPPYSQLPYVFKKSVQLLGKDLDIRGSDRLTMLDLVRKRLTHWPVNSSHETIVEILTSTESTKAASNQDLRSAYNSWKERWNLFAGDSELQRQLPIVKGSEDPDIFLRQWQAYERDEEFRSYIPYMVPISY